MYVFCAKKTNTSKDGGGEAEGGRSREARALGEADRASGQRGQRD